MKFLKWFSKNKSKKVDDQVLNIGLALAMEFGENWGKAIQPRLSKINPSLSELDLNVIAHLCKQAQSFSENLAYFIFVEQGVHIQSTILSDKVKSEYPWINDKNLSHLISQSIYYAVK